MGARWCGAAEPAAAAAAPPPLPSPAHSFATPCTPRTSCFGDPLLEAEAECATFLTPPGTPRVGELFPPVHPLPRFTRRSRLVLRDKVSGRVFRPNGRGAAFDTADVRSRICVWTKTGGDDAFFAGKKRRIEVQVQMQFKRPPRGVVYMGAEIERSMRIGAVARVACELLLAFCRGFHPRVDARIGAAGSDERPHMCLPLAFLIDAWHESRPEEPTPTLGTRFTPGSLGEMRRVWREKGPADHPFDPLKVYTFTWYSMYFDLEAWQVSNIPGASGTCLKSFWDEQPMSIICYSVPEGTTQHGPAARAPLFEIEIIHETHPQYAELAARCE